VPLCAAAFETVGIPRSFIAFICLWIVLGIGLTIFYRKAAYRTKKSAHPFIVIGFSVLFLAVAEWVMHGRMPVVFVVAVGIIAFLNIKLMSFCAGCGATVNAQGFSRPKFCPKCGGELERRT